ncbi:MAG: DUF3120 domain-containing protein [Cyanobium sp.]
MASRSQLPPGSRPLAIPQLSALLVVLPVFIQAPWVRTSPMTAALFTVLLVTLGIVLERRPQSRWRDLGALLVGFSGSWFAGCLFWGWCRLHPLWHLPIEAFALPLALAGLGGRWRLAGAFYLSSLLGTAATDLAMAISGVMPLWPQVLGAPLQDAPRLLHEAGLAVLQPLPLTVVSLCAAGLVALCTSLRHRGPLGSLAAVTLATTLAVDGLFLAAALAAPGLSGLI